MFKNTDLTLSDIGDLMRAFAEDHYILSTPAVPWLPLILVKLFCYQHPFTVVPEALFIRIAHL